MLLKIAIQATPTVLRRRLARLCQGFDVEVETLPGRTLHAQAVARSCCDVLVVSRACFAEPPAGVIAGLRQLPEPPSVVVLLHEKEDEEEAARLVAAGAEALLSPSLPDERLAEALRSILEKRRTFATAARQQRPMPSLADFVSVSPAMQAFLDLVRRVAPSDTSLLILGETGVGKEHLARAIHAASGRSGGPWVAVNCAALPDTLLESELFGHEEGAFTGALRTHRGSFEMAHRGTLFLDEIGEMPVHLQVKLLRVLQERVIQRLGGERTLPVDVRVMAATNRDIVADVEAGRFRRDLYFRLGVITLTVPPLRERREDIPALVQSHIAFLRTRVNRPVTGITPEALEALQQYPWPGNVRELMNVLERAMLLCSGNEITLNDLPHAIRTGLAPGRNGANGGAVGSPSTPPPEWLERPWEQVRQSELERIERAYFTALLTRNRGRIAETARQAGITPRALFEKMRRHGLRKEQFRGNGDGASPLQPQPSAGPPSRT